MDLVAGEFGSGADPSFFGSYTIARPTEAMTVAALFCVDLFAAVKSG
jgi:hypothetical protein